MLTANDPQRVIGTPELSAIFAFSLVPSLLGIGLGHLVSSFIKNYRCSKFHIKYPENRYADHLTGLNMVLAAFTLLPSVLKFYEEGRYAILLPGGAVVSLENQPTLVFTLTFILLAALALASFLACVVHFKASRLKAWALVFTKNAVGGTSLALVVAYLLLAVRNK